MCFENCRCYLFQGRFSILSVGVAPTKATSHLHSRNKNLRQRPVDSKEGAGICLLQRVCPTQCELIKANGSDLALMVDQGDADNFYQDGQLRPESLSAACQEAGVPITLRMQPGYDHSYFFIASFIDDHLKYHFHHLTA